jgi:fatty acid desaturase
MSLQSLLPNSLLLLLRMLLVLVFLLLVLLLLVVLLVLLVLLCGQTGCEAKDPHWRLGHWLGCASSGGGRSN